MDRVKISECCNISNGYAFKSEKYVTNEGARVIRITNVQKGQIVDNDPKLYPFDLLNNLDNYKIFEGDILMSLTGNVGRVGKFPKEMMPAYINQRICRIMPTDKRLDPNYLFHFFNNDKFEIEAMRNSAGAAQLNLTSKWLYNYEIPLPSLSTQKTIAAKLDKAQEIISYNKQLLEKYDQLTQSLFIDMFGSGNPKRDNWEEVKIENVVKNAKGSMRSGPFGSDLLHSEFVETGIPVLGIDNAVLNKFQWKQRRYITEEKYQKLKRYTVYPKDIIITIMGTVGRVAVVPDNIGIAINTKHLAAISLNQKIANPEFIAFSLRSDHNILSQINQKGKGAIMTGLNLTIIKELKLKLPPIHLQNQFSERMEKIEIQKQMAQETLAKSEHLFQSLLKESFR